MCDDFLFAEPIGAGRFHGAEEGFDWIYRILTKADFNVWFNPEIIFFHPQVLVDKGDKKALYRVFHYRAGFSLVCKKHSLYVKFASRLITVLGGILVYMFVSRTKFRYYLAEFCGLIAGLIMEP